MWQYQNTDELYHFGVLGMKWGIRKARQNGHEYNYKSHGQKKYIKKYEKLNKKNNGDGLTFREQRKFDKVKDKLATYKVRDNNRVNYVKNTTVGKTIVKDILFGPLGAGNYNRLRSSGSGRLISTIGASAVGIIFSKGLENASARSRARNEAANKPSIEFKRFATEKDYNKYYKIKK